MMHDHEKSDFAIVATKPTNNAGQPGGGVGGAKGGGQEERERAKHALDTEPACACHRRSSAYGKLQSFAVRYSR
jgi:hypothetical protein